MVAFYVLKNKDFGESRQTGTLKKEVQLLISMGAGFVIGIYDGLYGPGTGTFLLLILTGLAKLPVTEASGLTKVINLSSNVIHGTVYYPLGLAAAVFCIAGHYIGSGMVVSNGRKIVRPVVLCVLVVLFIKVLSGN